MWFLLLCALAAAEEQVVTIKKGERAPFTGTLLSPEAAAKFTIFATKSAAVKTGLEPISTTSG